MSENLLGETCEKEYVLRSRIRYFFETSFTVGDTRDICEYVGYDNVTGLPYHIIEDIYQSGHALMCDVTCMQITYDQVALFAKKYAPNSEFVGINDSNFESFIQLMPEKDFENSDMNLLDPKYALKRAVLMHKVVDGVRCAYQCITEDN